MPAAAALLAVRSGRGTDSGEAERVRETVPKLIFVKGEWLIFQWREAAEPCVGATGRSWVGNLESLWTLDSGGWLVDLLIV
jgi:hypothetical protein